MIAVVSGKGGTGKTLVAVNLALALAGEGLQVRLIDCDVEEPNDHLFLRPEIRYTEQVELAVPRVDPERCDLCRTCVDFCAFNALALAGNRIMVFDELCHSCGGCSLLCPNDAVREESVTIGSVECGSARAKSGDAEIRFCQGVLKIGEPRATPIVKRLKERIEEGAVNILDGGPGTGCSVMETVRGADYCLLVTEPTQFGLHDLGMALQMVQELGVPHGVIINKYIPGGCGVETWCVSNGLQVHLRIPYRREYSVLYSRGLNLVEEIPEWRGRFIHVFSRVEEEVEESLNRGRGMKDGVGNPDRHSIVQ